MKLFLFALAVPLTAQLFAQTRPTMVLPQCSANQFVYATSVTIPSVGGFPLNICVQLDGSSFSVDASTTPPTLRVKSSSGTVFVDPIELGTPDGTIVSFTLPGIPNPSTSLHIHRNGILLSVNVDFSLTGGIVTFKPGAVPQVGDVLLADWRQ
jgi:hypothetical protein